jgi:hypothetical protein
MKKKPIMNVGSGSSQENQPSYLYRNSDEISLVPGFLLDFLLAKTNLQKKSRIKEFLETNTQVKIFRGDIFFSGYRVSFVEKKNTNDLISNYPKISNSNQVPKLIAVIKNNTFSLNHNIAIFKVPYTNPEEIKLLTSYLANFSDGFQQDMNIIFDRQKQILQNDGISHPGLNSPNQIIFDKVHDPKFYLDGPTLFRKHQK